MVSYCTVQDVINELKGFEIDGTTTPSDTVVESWIEQESDLIKRDTNQIWGQETITDEYIDYDGTDIIRTKYSPIVSITSLEYESGITSEIWTPLTEGRYNNYITYNTEGEINLISPNIKDGQKRFKTTYVAGYTEVNPTVNMIVTKKVALRVIESVLNQQGSSQGGSISIGSISINDPTTFGIDNVRRLEGNIDSLTNKLGKNLIYRYNRKW